MQVCVYLCEDSIEGIFSAVYRAYADRRAHESNRIMLRTPGFNRELFCEYLPVETDCMRAVKVARTIQRDISGRAYEFVQKAAVSCRPEKADAIYRFIIEGLTVGSRVMDHLTAPFMQTLCALVRHTDNETHSFMEFLRFEELENGVLFGKINPKNDILPFLAGHFSDRFSGEDWVIADTVHQTVLIHRRGADCIYASMQEIDFDELALHYSAGEETMQRLWKTFVDAIAIRERVNPGLQRQMMPLRYRRYMREFPD